MARPRARLNILFLALCCAYVSGLGCYWGVGEEVPDTIKTCKPDEGQDVCILHFVEDYPELWGRDCGMMSQEDDCEKETGTCTCATDLCNEYKDNMTATTATPTEAPSTITSESANEYEDCGTTKGCLGLPENCVGTQDCKVLVSYMVNEEDKVQFTFRASISGGQYAAIGLSDVQKMENNSVMACWIDTSGNPQGVYGSWNYLHSNVNLDDPTAGLVTISKQYSDGMLKCTFTRETETVVSPPGLDTDFTFNLEEDSFYILMAYGPMSGDALSYHTERSISSEKVNLFEPFIRTTSTTTSSTASTTAVGTVSTSTLPQDLCFVPGEVSGVLIGVVSSSEYGACLDACRNLAGCVWFTEYYEENLCGMFETMSEIHDEDCPSCMSGHTGCTFEEEECSMPGLCEGELIHLEGAVATEQECQDMCEFSSAGCEYYTFDGQNDLCYSFEDCPTQSTEFCPAEHCVSGRPACPVSSSIEDYGVHK